MPSIPFTPEEPSARPDRIRRRGRGRRAIVAAVTALVAASGVTSTAAAPSPSSPPGDLVLDQPVTAGLLGDRTVTLLTGQQVTVHGAPDGRVTVDSSGTSNSSELAVTGFERPGEPLVLDATPTSAAALVADGVIDGDLFDLYALASRAFGDPSTPVTVHFDGATTAAESEQRAESLPGSTYAPGTATAGRATVTVPARSAEVFWDAVTTAPTLDPDDPRDQPWLASPGSAPRALADGVAGLTLDGAPLAPAAAPSTVATHQLTVRVHASEDPNRWTLGDWGSEVGLNCGLRCWSLIGVTGPSAGSSLDPTAVVCEGRDPICQTLELTFAVPSGIYHLGITGYDHRDTMPSVGTKFIEPEVEVFDDRTVDLSMDDGIWMDPHTAQPSDYAGRGITGRRSLPDGQVFYSIDGQNGEYYPGYYLAPTAQPAVTGAYNVQLMHEWREPYVTLTTSRGLDLRASYHPQDPYVATLPIRPELSLRDTRVGIVDAGIGTPEDFAGIDATGKLVVIGLSPELKYGDFCGLTPEVIDRAVAAGALAIVFDPRSDIYPTGACDVFDADLKPYTAHPIIMIQPEQARQLREQLTSTRPVTVNVDSPGHAGTGYLYELSEHFSGGIPQTIDQTVDPRNLATRTTTVHASKGLTADLYFHAWRPGFNLSINWGVRFLPTESSRTVTEYVEVSRDTIWNRSWGLTNADNRPAAAREEATEIVAQADERTEAFFAQPESIGPAISPADPGTWSGMWTLCNFCRAGDRLTPLSALSEPEATHQTSDGLLPAAVLTDADGQQIPLTVVSGLPGYQLSADAQRYTFASTMPGGSHFEWQFTSGHVSGDNLPLGTSCVQRYLEPGANCGAPQQLIYLRYNAPVDADNQAEAGSRHTVTVTPYHQAPGAPEITRVATQVSFDGGTTWTTAKMREDRGGSWTATFAVPELGDTDGYVTLRTTAADAAGNTTDQLRTHAYELK